jgi:hypothetical protein
VARGDIVTIANGATALRPLADAAQSLVVNNPNNGRVYVAADELPTTLFFDYLVQPNTSARLPGVFRETVGVLYQDLTGAGTSGQVELYRSNRVVDAPEYGPLGSATSTSFANVDLAQVATPSAPASGFSRLFASAVDQQLWYELPSGVLVPVSQQAKLQLNSVASSDLLSGVAATLNAWTNIASLTNFTVDDANSVVEAIANVSLQCYPGASSPNFTIRINVDDVSFQNFVAQNPAGSGLTNVFISGHVVFPITGLAAGTHGVKLQYMCTQAATLYCRPSSNPNIEWLALRVMEHKR